MRQEGQRRLRKGRSSGRWLHHLRRGSWTGKSLLDRFGGYIPFSFPGDSRPTRREREMKQSSPLMCGELYLTAASCCASCWRQSSMREQPVARITCRMVSGMTTAWKCNLWGRLRASPAKVKVAAVPGLRGGGNEESCSPANSQEAFRGPWRFHRRRCDGCSVCNPCSLCPVASHVRRRGSKSVGRRRGCE